ncbi:hypothetical protein F5884DRAFT_788431, partial [Xylogone sp. PMI_703]
MMNTLAKTNRNIRENFRRRTKTVIKNVNVLDKKFGADVFLLIRKHGKYYIYSSFENWNWIPSKDEVVSYSKSLRNQLIFFRSKVTLCL